MKSKGNLCAALAVALGLLHGGAARAESSEPAADATGPKASFALGLGGGIGSVDSEACRPGRDCEGLGSLALVSGHFNAFLGPFTLGARYVIDLNQDNDATEFAGLIGLRPGRSPVSFMFGPGTVTNANSRSQEKIFVHSWEILIAPHGRDVQYIVHWTSGDVDYVAFSVAAAFGSQ